MRSLFVIILSCLSIFSVAEVLAEVEADGDNSSKDIVVLSNTVGEGFRALGEYSGKSFIVDKGVADKPIVPFRAPSWEAARDKMLAETGLELQPMDGKGRVYFVRPPIDPDWKKRKPKRSEPTPVAVVKDDSVSAKPAQESVVEDPVKAAEEKAPQLTRLRVVKGPDGKWQDTVQGAKLQYVYAQVKNTGSVEAEGVNVEVLLSGGDSFRMEGPANLGRGETADYSTSPPLKYYKKPARLRLKAECSNCRR